MKPWQVFLGLAVVVVGGILALYYVFPELSLEPARNYLRSQAKLEKKSVTVGDHEIVYLEGGKGDPTVLVHGFGGNKDAWDLFAKHLTSTQQVIALDLPGFGQSSRVDGADYGYEKQAERLHAFVGQLGLKKFHLVGHSMGGAIAALYAARHTDRLLTLALFAPVGVKSKEMSEYAKALARKENPLEVHSVEDLDRFLAYVFLVPPEIPGIVKRGLAKEAIQNAAFNAALAEKLLRVDPAFLEKDLPHVGMSTLVVWCEKDRIVHPSGAHVFAEKLPHDKILMLKNCGHVPHGERPVEVGQAYYEFVEAARRAGAG
jgi:pimeloyl-ACP methyl ester carboxylesterase